MNQRTHAWIALRAVALLEEQEADPDLVGLLKQYGPGAAVGAWIPDLSDAKRGGSKTQHHILKILPYDGPGKPRFVAKKEKLLKRLGAGPAVRAYLDADQSLDGAWWGRAYKADPGPGQHLGNRAMGLAVTLRDLLLLGDEELDGLIEGEVGFLVQMKDGARTRGEQAALYAFMLSHFLADACMPCHCDGRKLAGYAEGLHDKLEGHWSRQVGTAFDQKKIAALGEGDAPFSAARKVDTRFGLRFDVPLAPLPKGRDVWLETVDMCRASFALASVLVPESRAAYDDEAARAPFDEVFGGAGGEALLAEVDRTVLHDAVWNTAAVWADLWARVEKPQ